MAYREINARVKIRRDTAINFTTKNPILLAGELAVEQDTNRAKVGNGSDPWIKLPYLVDMDSIRKLVEESFSNSKNSSDPIGNIVYVASSFVPVNWKNNWLICNGASVSKTIYPDLFSAMGWSDSTHALPNLIDNRFIEGSTSTWQYKNAGLPNIKGYMAADDTVVFQNYNGVKMNVFGCFKPITRVGSKFDLENSGYSGGTIRFDASRSGTESSNGIISQWNTIYSDSVNTVQLKSMTLLPIIRVK